MVTSYVKTKQKSIWRRRHCIGVGITVHVLHARLVLCIRWKRDHLVEHHNPAEYAFSLQCSYSLSSLCFSKYRLVDRTALSPRISGSYLLAGSRSDRFLLCNHWLCNWTNFKYLHEHLQHLCNDLWSSYRDILNNWDAGVNGNYIELHED